MNDINELIAIITSLGNRASFLNICNEYQKKNKTFLSSLHKTVIAKTLNDNSDKVFFDVNTNEWVILAKTLNKKVNQQKVLSEDKKNVLFVNIAYMKEYKGITESDKPINGGSYIGETANAGEKNNFLARDNGKTIGFAEPGWTEGGYQGGGKQKQIHIEKIDDQYKNEEKIDGVTVIQCARSPIIRKTVIVGWYENATVYRTVDTQVNGDDDCWRAFECKNIDAYLIDETQRSYIVPRASQDGIGFGQSNYWYATKPEEQDVVQSALKYIESLKTKDNGNLRESIEQTYKKYFSDNDATLMSSRNAIYIKGVELYKSKVGYRICFKDKEYNQELLDDLNQKYGIIVHYDNNHRSFTKDVSKYEFINKKQIVNPTKGYLEITKLTEDDAVKIAKILVSQI